MRRKPTLSILLIGLVLLAACQDETPDPVAPDRSATAHLSASGDRPFYYYQGQPVYLDINPAELVVDTEDPAPIDAARQIVAAVGVSVTDAGMLPQVRGHRLLRLAGASATDAERAAALLRADRRFSFVSPAFRTVEGRHPVLLVNRIDVQFKEGVTNTQVDSLNRALGTRTIRPPRPDSGFFAYRLAYPAGAEPLATAQTLYRHPLVKWADADKISDFRPDHAPSDPYYGLQFHLKNWNTRNGIPVDINIESAWDLTRGSNTIRVTIIDDGIDVVHGSSGGGYSGDLTGGSFTSSSGYDLVPAPDEHSHKPCCNDTHGTSVAGIIGAAHNNSVGGAGIAPNVILNSVRIFRRTYPPESEIYPYTQAATANQIADGINWAWRYANSDVINNSWSGGVRGDAITFAILNALGNGRGGKGTVVVFSAGNTADRQGLYRPADNGYVRYPASLSSEYDVISVGAINRSGDPANYTPDGRIDVVAPSGHTTGFCVGAIVTTDRYGSFGCNDGPNGDAHYTTTFSGTSAAAPQVSGVAALMLSYNPSLSAAQVKSRIRSSADSWGSSTTFGAGKLNAYRALTGGSTGGGGEPEPCEPVPPELICAT